MLGQVGWGSQERTTEFHLVQFERSFEKEVWRHKMTFCLRRFSVLRVPCLRGAFLLAKHPLLQARRPLFQIYGPFCTEPAQFFPTADIVQSQWLHLLGSIPVTPTTKIFPKLLRYKWEAYRNTDGRSTDSISLSSEHRGTGCTAIQMGGILQYK